MIGDPGPNAASGSPADPANRPLSGIDVNLQASRRTVVDRGRIVHVSADYPDTIRPAKTRAIESFVHLADSAFDQEVISLNRADVGFGFVSSVLLHPLRPRLDVQVGTRLGRTTPVLYHAPGKGLYHATMLRQVGEWLAERLSGGERPALIVGHKLTFEGLAVAEAARLLDVPYALTIQGDSDLKVLDSRPDLRASIGTCFHNAAVVVAIAPWALARVTGHLGERQGPTMVVPCAVSSDRCIAPRLDGDGLISVFHLRNSRRKNLGGMAQAITRPAPRSVGARLAIVGDGTAAEVGAAAAMAGGRARGLVTFEGHLPLAEIPARMNRASGYVMPSLRESFGLVFIEALMAGTPIAYPRAWSVDGFFDDLPFAIPVAARSIDSIADAMARLVRDERMMKRALARWQEQGGADRFRADHIAASYIEALSVGADSAVPRVA